MVDPEVEMTKGKSKDLWTLTMQDVWTPENICINMFSLGLGQPLARKKHFIRS